MHHVLFSGKWHQGLNLNYVGDNYYNPLNQGFDYFYGLPFTNLRDFGVDEIPTILVKVPRFSLMCHTASIFGFLLLLTLYKYGIIGIKLLLLLAIFLMGFPQLVLWIVCNTHTLGGVVMRNYDVVEQPVRMEGMTKRLVQEGVEFVEQRHQDQQPFLLYMSWLQVFQNNLPQNINLSTGDTVYKCVKCL